MSAVLADAAERQQALNLNHSVLVQAPAGSGKTGLLIQRLLACLATVDRPEQIVAITFTKKAAAEMRHRLNLALLTGVEGGPTEVHLRQTWQLARQALDRDAECGWNLLQNPSRLRIQTIDSLNQHLAMQAPLLSGLTGSATTEDARLLFRRAILRLFSRLERRDTDEVLRAALRSVLLHFDNRLDKALRMLEAMLGQRDQWLSLVLEGGVEDESQWDVMLHDLVAARLEEIELHIPMDLANRYAKAISDAADREIIPWVNALNGWPTLAPGNLTLLRQISGLVVKTDGDFRKTLDKRNGFPSSPETTTLKALLKEWPDGGETLRLALDEIQRLPDPDYPDELSALRQDLCLVLRELVLELKLMFAGQGEVDFTEVAGRAQWALKQGDHYTPVMERQDQLVKHLLVDEMQDTSQSQLALLELLTAGWTPGDGRSLFMVGDPMQSIYAFRQADVRLFLGMMESQMLGGVPLKVLALSANFRSQSKLIDWFNASFVAIFPAQQDVWRGLAGYKASVATQPGLNVDAAIWHAAVGADDDFESANVVGVVQAILVGDADADIAILVRARKHLPQILSKLRCADITYQCQDVDPVASLSAVADALGLIRACWHPADVTAWTTLMRTPIIGLSWKDIVALSILRHQGATDTFSTLLQAPESALLSVDGKHRIRNRLLGTLGRGIRNPELRRSFANRIRSLWFELGADSCYSQSELNDVSRLFNLLEKHCAGGVLQDYAAFTNGVQRLFAQPVGGGVQVLTMHKAKGLEFDYVLLPGLGKKPKSDDSPVLAYESLQNGYMLVPKPKDSHAEHSQRLFAYITDLKKARNHAEVLRLLYVAATRARKQLHLFGSANMDKKREIKPNSGSLLQALWPVCAHQFEGLDDLRGTDGDVKPPPKWLLPIRARCAPDHGPRCADAVWQPPLKSEVGSALQNKADTAATMIGEMFHAAMEKMTMDGVWEDGGESRRMALASGFRRRGMPEPVVEEAVGRVLQLVAKTIESEAGQWLLQRREWVKAEYSLEGYVDSDLISGRIDLCFQDGGDYWVIDYKAAQAPVLEADEQEYIARQRAEYAGQLENYAVLLALDRGVETVRTALYLPEIGRLEEL